MNIETKLAEALNNIKVGNHIIPQLLITHLTRLTDSHSKAEDRGYVTRRACNSFELQLSRPPGSFSPSLLLGDKGVLYLRCQSWRCCSQPCIFSAFSYRVSRARLPEEEERMLDVWAGANKCVDC